MTVLPQTIAYARYVAITRDEIESGFDLMQAGPYSVWEGWLEIPDTVPVEGWTEYALRLIAERFKREPMRLEMVISRSANRLE
jgi:hypothetical protein